MPGPVETWPTTFVLEGERQQLDDPVAVEEPLEVRLIAGGEEPWPWVTTLRTPGNDEELVAGLLYAEGIVDRAEQLAGLSPAADSPEHSMVVTLAPGVVLERWRLQRSLVATAACGLCGRVTVSEALDRPYPPPPVGPRLDPAVLAALPQRMRLAQEGFARTGGVHAAALFTPAGELLCLREDIGRHNAVDKVVGAELLAGRVPPGESVLMVSGRIGFEIAQKVVRAGIPVLAAVGAPSSLALRLARQAGTTVAGFVRPGRFNVYCGEGRLS